MGYLLVLSGVSSSVVVLRVRSSGRNPIVRNILIESPMLEYKGLTC